MPQMSPLMWNNLFIMFSLLIIMTMIKMYFSTNKNIIKETKKTKMNSTKSHNWTW